jgi:predicted AlkP superfamily pyrophosphatase or phosphodiesterase
MLFHKHPFRLTLSAFFILILAACSVHEEPSSAIKSDAPASEQTPPLLLISIDGVRYDYLEKANLPTFELLINGGLKADSLQQIFPTKTFATHYSMVTGLHPDRSGVVANSMWDPEREARFSMGNRDAVGDGYWYEGEPIWNTVEKAGKQAATYFWPGSEAEIGGIRPTIWMPYDGDATHDERVAQVLAWLDMPEQARPDFLTLYFSVVDSAGHRHGPDHPEVVSALQEVDRALGLLVEGLQQRDLLNNMHILVTSDHGMQTISSDRYILLDEFLDLSKVRVSDWGPAAQIWTTEDGLSVDQIVGALKGAHPNMRVWKKADVPPRYHFSEHKRVPDVVAEADLGWMISSKPYYERLEPGRLGGMHGWDPAWQNMHGIFIAHGPAFAAGSKTPALRGIDLYSLMAELMQIEPVNTDGSLNAFAPIIYNSAPSEVRASYWFCDSVELVLREGPGSASLQFGERVFSLPRVKSASGVRYEDTDMLFWSKGSKARVMISGQPLSNCTISNQN